MKLYNRLKRIVDRMLKLEVSRQNLAYGFIPFWLEVIKFEVIRKFMLKLQRKRYGIVSTNIETISTCNRKCEFCFNHPRFQPREQGIMSVETWQRIIDQLSAIDFAGRIGPHFFNEPLLDSRLPELLEYARTRLPYAWIQINSNGDFLTEELFLKLRTAGVNFFYITNYDEDDKPLLNELQARYPGFVKVVLNSEMWRTDRGGEIFQKEKVLKSGCMRPGAQLVVNWKAEMLLCCMDFYAKYSFGDLKEDNFLKIMLSESFQKMAKKINSSRQDGYPICHNCDDPGNIPW